MKRIAEALSDTKVKTAIAALLAIGLILIFFPRGKEKETEQNQEVSASDEMLAYAEMLEKGLQKAVARMTNDHNAEVMVTLDGTFENVYVSDASINEAVTSEKTDRKSEKQLVLTGAGDNGQIPVIVKKLPPKIKGAVIVCSNGNNADTAGRVTSLAATVLGISETKIYVTGGN